MSTEWIASRREQYRQKEEEQRRRYRLEMNADEAGPGLFDALRVAVQQNMEESNRQFQDVYDARCYMQVNPDGWTVSREGKPSLIVKRRGNTLIEFAVAASSGSASQQKRVEGQIRIKPDPGSGNIVFEYNRNEYADTDQMAEILLDHILPGPKDFDRK